MIGKLLRDLGWLAPGPFWTKRRKRIATGTLLAAFAIGAYAVWRDDRPSKEEALRQGDELAGKNQPLKAATAYRMALEQDPDDGHARIKLAKAYAAGGRWAEATREAVRAADLMPDDLEAQTLAVTRLNSIGNFYNARTRAASMLKNHPDDPNLLIQWANANAGISNSYWALYTFPDVVPSLNEFNTIRRRLRQGIPEADDAEAGAAIRKARRTAPGEWEVNVAMVNFLWATGRPEEAEPMLKELADQAPREPIVNYALAKYYGWRGQPDAAEVHLKNAAAAGPSGRNAR